MVDYQQCVGFRVIGAGRGGGGIEDSWSGILGKGNTQDKAAPALNVELTEQKTLKEPLG